MAKITYLLMLLFLICSCNNSGVPDTRLEEGENDIPIQVDTSYADTTFVEDSLDTVLIKEDTIVVIPEKEYPPLQEVYTSFIGVRELTGKNDGPEVKMFMATVGLGEGYPWCAGFVKYCMLEAGIKSAEVMNGMALSTENKKNIIYKSGKFNRDLEPGDVFTLYYASLKRIGHTGFFDRKINSTLFETVEGNTNMAGSREGDGVYRKKRSFNSTYSISRWE